MKLKILFLVLNWCAFTASAAVIDYSGNIGNGYSSFQGLPFPGPDGSTVYLQGSPFAAERPKMSEFYLEDFEDHLLNTPFVTSQTAYEYPYGVLSMRRLYEMGLSGQPSSVDGDDGIINGRGHLGDSWFGQVGLHFTPNAEGRYPNYAGLVITLGYSYPPLSTIPTFYAYGPAGEFLYEITLPGATFQFDGSGGMDTSADTFVGIYASEGISALVASPLIALEIDHVQYGWALIPEPSAALLVLVAGAGLLSRRRRGRR